jgi:putative hydrolase of the HAD superfamily
LSPVTKPLAVTFDFWNTLVEDGGPGYNERRVAAWVGLLADAGHELEHQHITPHMEAVTEDRIERWKAGDHFAAPEATDALLDRLGLVEEMSPELRAQLAEAFADPSADHVPPLTPNVAAALAQLDDAGVRIGIVCDVGFTPSPVLRRHLKSHGVLDHFDHWSFSDEVGVFKPDPVIFRHALDGLGIDDPARVAHVGDLRRTDVAGAKGMGMIAVRYAGIYDDPGYASIGTEHVEGDVVVTDHADLVAALFN